MGELIFSIIGVIAGCFCASVAYHFFRSIAVLAPVLWGADLIGYIGGAIGFMIGISVLNFIW